MVAAWMMIASLVELVYLVNSIVILRSIISKVSLVTLVDWITSSSWLSLLTEFGLCNRFRNWRIVWMVSTGWSWEHSIVISVGWVEELCRHHHLLLLIILSTRCLSLVDQIEEMSLILILMASDSTCGTDAVIAYTRCCSSKSTATAISFNLIHHVHVILLLMIEAIDWGCMASIALPQFSHKITIKHSLTHLLLFLIAMHWTWSTIIALDTKSSNSGLVEHMCIILSKVSMMTLIIYIR